MSTVPTYITTLKTQFNPEEAKDIDAVFQFNVTNDVPYFLTIKNQTCTVSQGTHAEATVTLVMDSDTLQLMSTSELDAIQAFMAGKLRVEGDMMMAMKLNDLFGL